MQIIISPAKSLDFETKLPYAGSTDYRFTKEPQQLIKHLSKLKPKDLEKLMSISSKLADLNYTRFQHWHYPFEKTEGRQTLFAFNGEVYNGIDAYTLNKKEIEYAQDKLRILSGFYGLLRPLDLILPYRLEMGTKIQINKHKNLYEFWGDKITQELNNDIEKNKHQALINLASNEYYKSIHPKNIKAPIITPEFKDLKNGQYKMISIYAKKARGIMTRFIIQNELDNINDLKAFDLEGYYYNNQLSTNLKPVFTRDH